MSAETFGELRAIAMISRSGEAGLEAGRERLIRFLDTYAGNTPETPMVDSLCAHLGLFPYMSNSAEEGDAEALALEFHTPPELAEEGFTFHAMQHHVYARLMDGESIVLSAPTSFGKSAIMDALIASNKWSQIVLIVPTIALIDETRRRLARFRSNYTVISHASQISGPRNIYVLTQERFLEIGPIADIDFFVIDEFYKLGAPDPYDQRKTLLNIAWKRLRDTGAQYYLIGPNIDSLNESVTNEVRGSLVTTGFKTVAVDVIDRSEVEDRLEDVRRLLQFDLDGPSLVFASSPEKAENVARELLGSIAVPAAGSLPALVSSWLAENYDPAWNVVDTLAAGIAIHSGPMPRSVQRIMVRLFNEGHLGLMVCTSTLIEGVNTAAKNVIIYDKRIDGRLLDFFTFSNIRGRAGRMFRHFVGRVVTYSQPPELIETEVDIPIESQSSGASLATLVQLDFANLSKEAQGRVRHVFEQTDLSVEVIRENRGLDPDLQIGLAQRLREDENLVARLAWTGLPRSTDARRTLEVAFEELLIPRQRRGINFNMLWGQLQNARAHANDFSGMVTQQQTYARKGQDRGNVVLDVFRFQRNWMGFTIPSMLRGMQSIHAEIADEMGVPRANYELLLREIESLYLPGSLPDLEEYGLPVPLGVKVHGLGMRGDTVEELLDSLSSLAHQPGFLSQLSIVEQWVVLDVVAGYAGPESASAS